MRNRNCHFYLQKIIICTLAAIFFISPYTCAQKLDSLRAVIKEHPFDDTTAVILMCRLAEAYKSSSPDSMMAVAQRALALADKIKFNRGRATSLTQLGTALLIKNHYDKALSVYNEAATIYGKYGGIPEIAASYHNIGNAYYVQARYGIALEYFTKSMVLFEEIKDKSNIGGELNSIGNIYKDLGDYSEAIQNYLNALKLIETDKNNPDLPTCLTNIATVYSMMGEYAKSLDYIHRSLILDEAAGNQEGRLYNIVNIGIVDAESKDYKSALAAFNQGFHIADSLKDDYWKTTCEGNIGEAYFFLGEYDKASGEYEVAIAEATRIKEENTVASCENGLGNLFIKKGQVREGIKHFLVAFNIVKQVGAKQPMFEIASDLSDAYEKVHDYEHALQYHKIYFDLRDSLFNEKSDRHIQQLQFDYELGKKEARIQLLEKNKAIEQSRIEKQRVVVWALLSGLALLILIVFILFRSRRQVQRSKDNILGQKAEIQQQAVKLEELNRFKDKTFSVLSHDLRGPIYALAATMELMDENQISPEEFAMLKPEVNKQLSALIVLLDNILNWAKGYILGQTNASPATIDLAKIIHQNMRLIQGIAANKQIEVQNNIPASASIYCDPGQMDIVIRNLLMNALKFTDHKGTITLNAASSPDTVKITITDTGIGMTKEQMNKLFVPVAGNSTYGTDGEAGTGLGLLLCYEFIKANNGTISVASEPGKGSTFTITLPAGPRS
jgi:signal transduction histidine kinase/predicted negative regulator of RcsB-dependent stress response